MRKRKQRKPERLSALHDAILLAQEQLEGKGELFWRTAVVEDPDVVNFHFTAVDFVRQMNS